MVLLVESASHALSGNVDWYLVLLLWFARLNQSESRFCCAVNLSFPCSSSLVYGLHPQASACINVLPGKCCEWHLCAWYHGVNAYAIYGD